MGNYISYEDLDEIKLDYNNSCNTLRLWVNNLWKYIYNGDEKKHMQ